jgi:hypothetical protein
LWVLSTFFRTIATSIWSWSSARDNLWITMLCIAGAPLGRTIWRPDERRLELRRHPIRNGHRPTPLDKKESDAALRADPQRRIHNPALRLTDVRRLDPTSDDRPLQEAHYNRRRPQAPVSHKRPYR